MRPSPPPPQRRANSVASKTALGGGHPGGGAALRAGTPASVYGQSLGRRARNHSPHDSHAVEQVLSPSESSPRVTDGMLWPCLHCPQASIVEALTPGVCLVWGQFSVAGRAHAGGEQHRRPRPHHMPSQQPQKSEWREAPVTHLDGAASQPHAGAAAQPAAAAPYGASQVLPGPVHASPAPAVTLGVEVHA